MSNLGELVADNAFEAYADVCRRMLTHALKDLEVHVSNLGEFVTDNAFEAVDFVAYLRDHLLAIPQHQLLNLCRCELFLKLINALEATHAA